VHSRAMLIPFSNPVVQDPFSSFERNHPTLVAIDSHGFARNKLNFFEREREEMRVLTQASEISENVWVSWFSFPM
jgi:dual specificity MAP kinase phosphatase